jgi:hypothetical protein
MTFSTTLVDKIAILTAVLLKNSVYWDVTESQLICASCLLHVDFLLLPLFGPEGGGDMYLRNI